MIRRFGRISGLFCLMAATFLTGSSSAGKQLPPVMFSTTTYIVQQPVEQQTPGWGQPCPATEPVCAKDQTLWVVNRTGWLWDVDDYWTRFSNNGTLEPGATVTDQVGYIADCDGTSCGPFRIADLRLSSASSHLLITVTISPGPDGGPPVVYTVASPVYVKSTREWEYTWCAYPPSYQYADPNLQPIPDSNGGTGVPTSVTLSVTNMDSRRTNVGGSWGLDQENTGARC